MLFQLWTWNANARTNTINRKQIRVTHQTSANWHPIMCVYLRITSVRQTWTKSSILYNKSLHRSFLLGRFSFSPGHVSSFLNAPSWPNIQFKFLHHLARKPSSTFLFYLHPKQIKRHFIIHDNTWSKHFSGFCSQPLTSLLSQSWCISTLDSITWSNSACRHLLLTARPPAIQN